jgi:opacity protein-like surface antigen
MKRLILGAAAALLLSAGPAAADGMPTKGHVRGSDSGTTWGGLYLGLHAGLGVGNTEGQIGPITSDYEVSGGLYGVQLGWLGQWGNVVAGIEGTYSGSSIQGNDAGCLVFIVGFDCSREVNAIGTVVGRAGLAYDRALIYGLAGVAWADVDTEIRVLNTPFLSGGETHVGWTAGFGLEWALSNRVSARIEYAHTDFGSETHSLSIPGVGGAIPDRVSLDTDTVKLGINVKLGH